MPCQRVECGRFQLDGAASVVCTATGTRGGCSSKFLCAPRVLGPLYEAGYLQVGEFAGQHSLPRRWLWVAPCLGRDKYLKRQKLTCTPSMVAGLRVWSLGGLRLAGCSIKGYRATGRPLYRSALEPALTAIFKAGRTQ